MDEILSKLQAICGPEHVSNERVDLLCYRRDCGPTPGGTPGYVCRPETTEEVVKLVKLANELKKPLFLWGRATTFVDCGVMNDCIVLALDLMNKFEVNLEDQVVHAETGTVWHAMAYDPRYNRLYIGTQNSTNGGQGGSRPSPPTSLRPPRAARRRPMTAGNRRFRTGAIRRRC